MQYRVFGKKGLKVSALGFGLMRLPIIGGDPSRIDVESTREMVRVAVQGGVNYFDTAYSYHGGESERVAGRILKEEGLREQVNVATKCPSWLVEKRSDFDKYLAEQMEKLQTDHIDMYLMHALNKSRWDALEKADVSDFLRRALSDGRISYAGFSFHDDLDTFKRIVDSYDWDFCQIQYNYMDECYQAGTEGLRYAGARGLPVVVMEPLRGGSLVKNVPGDILAAWGKHPVKRTPASWGLRWVWNHGEVAVVLSGMGTVEQVKENMETAGTALPGTLGPDEMKLYDEVRAVYNERIKVPCTGCLYCDGCPQGIKIAGIFSAYNEAYKFGATGDLKGRYEQLRGSLGDPASCIECGACEDACPQNIPIRKHLKEIDADLRGLAPL